MGVNLGGFDAQQAVDESGDIDFSPMPAGWYQCVLIDANMKDNSATAKDPNGQNLELVFQVTQDEFNGRKLWEKLNLVNSNPQAVQIAKGSLGKVSLAVGVPLAEDTDDLLGIDLMIEVKLKDGTNGPRNEINNYKSMADFAKMKAPAAQRSTAKPAAQAPSKTPAFAQRTPPAQAAAAAPAKSAGPAWARK